MSNLFNSCSKYIQIDKYTLHCHHREGTGKSAIVFLHGYPSSSLDYEYIWDYIPKEYSILAHDHLGFGKSDKPYDYSYSLIEQADYAIKLCEKLSLQKIHLIAHDYGTSVATEIIARDNNKKLQIDIQSVTLCNGSMLIDMAKLRPIQRLLKNKWVGPLIAKFSGANVFHRNMRNIWYDPYLYDQEHMQEHWNLLISNGGRKVLSKITNYIDQRYAYYDKWIGALKKTRLPIHVLWAANDRIAIVDMADKLESIIPNNKKTIINKCGHYPMIEQPEKWVTHLLSFI